METVIAPTFLKHRGKTLMLAAPPLSAWEELGKYFRSEYMAEAKEQMHGLPLPLAQHAWDSAKVTADAIKPVNEPFLEALQKPNGICYFAYLILKVKQPDMTLDYAKEIVTDGSPAEYAERVATLLAAAGFAGNPTGGAAPATTTTQA